MIRLIGAFGVVRAGRVLTDAEIGSRKARALLALLAVEPDRSTNVDHIVVILWDDARPLDPPKNVAALVSRLRRSFGPEVIVRDRAGYRLGDHLRVDLHDAAAMVRRAELRSGCDGPTRAFAAARRALRVLDGGRVLEDYPGADWADSARSLHGSLVRRARHTVAALALRLRDIPSARTAAEEAMVDDALDEVACRYLMQAHMAAGEPARALDAYERLRTGLANELGTNPAESTQDLHLAILRGQTTQAGTVASGLATATRRRRSVRRRTRSREPQPAMPA